MTSGNHPINERIQDLLADRALHGLSMDESEELARLAVDSGTSTDDTLESTAAILHEALLLEGELEDLPRDLESRLMQSAAFLAPVEAPSPAQTPTTARDSSLGWIAASVAAAAALVMMVSLVFSRPDPTAASTPETAAADFERSTGDVRKADWNTVKEGFARVEGHVSWSAAKQSGFMHLKGLPVNNAAKVQYQLWIVDGKRKGAPVDGGVFDVRSDGEVVVPITAKLQVADAKAFVITREVPGGVVVSKGPHLVVAAL